MTSFAETYLSRLAERLLRGLDAIEAERREQHRRFLLAQQASDGGFCGRDSESDLYYTGFAARAVWVLGGLPATARDAVGRYLRSFRHDRLNVIDLLSWLYCGLVVGLSGGEDPFRPLPAGWMDAVADRLERLRRPDGGYAKADEGAAGSTYHSFLVALTYELIGRDVPQSERLVEFLFERQRDDGGFVEIAPMKRSGTNPTAAAVALLRKYGELGETEKGDVLGFLEDVRSPDGGFQANTRIPFADGLSTFTGLLTAHDLGVPDLLPADRVALFVGESLESPGGGFRAAAWDDQPDVEYTFYGLGILGLLHGGPA